MRRRVGASGSSFESLGNDLTWCPGVQHVLPSGIVCLIEAAQQLFEGAVRVDVNVEHLADDSSVEAFDYAVGLSVYRDHSMV